MSLDEVTTIQTEANKLVFEGRKVHIEVEELDRDQEKDAPIHQSGRTVGRGLPQDYTGGVKRVVVIDGVDRNPYVVFGSIVAAVSWMPQLLWYPSS
jgi:misacylated tRNA(Ala) deacylase